MTKKEFNERHLCNTCLHSVSSYSGIKYCNVNQWERNLICYGDLFVPTCKCFYGSYNIKRCDGYKEKEVKND